MPLSHDAADPNHRQGPKFLASQSPSAFRPRFSLRQSLVFAAVMGLVLSYALNFRRMRIAEYELRRLQNEVGYLEGWESDEIAAVRIAADQPLTWQARVHVPSSARYRLAYSAVWRSESSKPDWFSAVRMPAGESIVTIRVLKDPRDDRWKISTAVRNPDATDRAGTVLPDEISEVLRGSHDVISAGIRQQTTTRSVGQSLRLFDERYFSGSSLLLYGDRPPEEDLIGIFAELQPDVGTL